MESPGAYFVPSEACQQSKEYPLRVNPHLGTAMVSPLAQESGDMEPPSAAAPSNVSDTACGPEPTTDDVESDPCGPLFNCGTTTNTTMRAVATAAIMPIAIATLLPEPDPDLCRRLHGDLLRRLRLCQRLELLRYGLASHSRCRLCSCNRRGRRLGSSNVSRQIDMAHPTNGRHGIGHAMRDAPGDLRILRALIAKIHRCKSACSSHIICIVGIDGRHKGSQQFLAAVSLKDDVLATPVVALIRNGRLESHGVAQQHYAKRPQRFCEALLKVQRAGGHLQLSICHKLAPALNAKPTAVSVLSTAPFAIHSYLALITHSLALVKDQRKLALCMTNDYLYKHIILV